VRRLRIWAGRNIFSPEWTRGEHCDRAADWRHPLPLAACRAKATEGLARPQVRRCRGNLTTNFRLAGLTSQRLLARFTSAVPPTTRAKGAIGYYGLQQEIAG
jgi:hypothetical protein